MAQELEKAGCTELQVRMHCNGCAQRIKRALLNIDGVSDVCVDLAGQKVTVVGSADPENIVKAMKKARKKAIIFSHTQAASEGGGAGTEKPEAAAAEQTPSTDDPPPPNPFDPAPPPDDAAKVDDAPPPQEEPEAKPSTGANYVEEAEVPPMAHYYPYDGVRRDRWGGYVMMMFEHPNYHAAAHSSYPTLSYAPEYGQSQRSLLPHEVGGFDEEGNYDRSRRGGSDGNQITSLFSDENPNACRIV